MASKTTPGTTRRTCAALQAVEGIPTAALEVDIIVQLIQATLGLLEPTQAMVLPSAEQIGAAERALRRIRYGAVLSACFYRRAVAIAQQQGQEHTTTGK